ncbi:MAG: hypothetical protein IT539_12055 [Bradyrhizobiaceae bacterium]|nr:hypothetical protein [Bradyrhizobiaceae bacterium]
MRGKTSKLAIFGAASLALTLAAPAFAADMPVYTKAPAAPAVAPSPFDAAFGGWIGSDYNFRGVSQSDRDPSAGAYFEGQYNGAFGQWYLGIGGASIKWPGVLASGDYGLTDPAAEIDFFGGWRKSWDKFSADIGVIYYYYPGEVFNGFTSDSDFWEVYWKGGYAVNDALSVGANVFYTPDLLNYSQTFATITGTATKADAVYASLTAKYVLPWTSGNWGSFVSGEIGHWWIDDSGFLAAGQTADPSYTYWNAGFALTYKAVTLDFRYHGTSQNRQDCANFLVTVATNSAAGWCKDAFIATLKFDTTLSALK